MRMTRFIMAVCAVLVCGYAAAPPAPTAQATNRTKTTPLILEKNEGERRVVRGWPGHPDPGETFILKVDPKNGGFSHLGLFIGDPRPGKGNGGLQHPPPGEKLFLEAPNAPGGGGDSARGG